MGMDGSTSCHLDAGQGEGRELCCSEVGCAVYGVACGAGWCGSMGRAGRDQGSLSSAPAAARGRVAGKLAGGKEQRWQRW